MINKVFAVISFLFGLAACTLKPDCQKSISEEVRVDSLKVKRVIYRDAQGKAIPYQGQKMLAMKPSIRLETAFEIVYTHYLMNQEEVAWNRVTCAPEAPYYSKQSLEDFRVFMDVDYDAKHPAGSNLLDILEKEIYWYNLVFEDLSDYYRFTDSSAYFNEMRFRFKKAPEKTIEGNLYASFVLSDQTQDTLWITSVDFY